MATSQIALPEGFELEEQANSGLPEGFVLEKQGKSYSESFGNKYPEGKIGQFFKSLYEGVPFGKKMTRAIDPERADYYENMPAPEGIGEKLSSASGAFLPFASLSKPFFMGAGAAVKNLPKFKGLAQSALGLGAFEGTKEALKGSEAKDVAKSTVGGALTGATFHAGSKVGSTLFPRVPFTNIQNPRFGSAVGGGAAGALTDLNDPLTGAVFGAGLGAIYPANPKKIDMTKIAARLNNSLIKPREKELLYGNPGEGIAREGIVGKNFADLEAKVISRTEQLNRQLKTELTKATGENIQVNIGDALKPIYELQIKLAESPATNKEAMSRLSNILSDMTGESTGKIKKLEGITPQEAVEFKRYISGLQDWQAQGDRNREINVAIRKVYHNIDKSVDQAVPKTKLLNKRLTDLITAKQAIAHRRNVVERQNLVGLSPRLTGMFIGGATGGIPGGIGGYAAGIGVEKALGSTPFKTGLASAMADKYNKGTPLDLKLRGFAESANKKIGDKGEIINPFSQQEIYNPSNSVLPETGKPFKAVFVRSKESAPKYFGNRFGQDFEPSGKYITVTTKNVADGLSEKHFEKGIAELNNPLVIEFKSTDANGWKKDLMNMYNGKKGKKLSEAIKKDGYDSIITVDSKNKIVNETIMLGVAGLTFGAGALASNQVQADSSKLSQEYKQKIANAENAGNIKGDWAQLENIVIKDLQQTGKLDKKITLDQVKNNPELYEQVVKMYWDRMADFGIPEKDRALWWLMPGRYKKTGGDINKLPKKEFINIMQNRVKNINYKRGSK